MSRGWLGVVAADHVARGAELGIAQINHGNRTALARMHAGDTLVYYSPTRSRGDGVAYRRFTVIGTLPDDDIWQADEGSFQPFRRRFDVVSTTHVPLERVRDSLRLTADPHWGYRLRLGLVPLEPEDLDTLREAMTA